jgi:Tfp pilus assembly protein PilF/mono/diheme cytochrome c family protein
LVRAYRSDISCVPFIAIAIALANLAGCRAERMAQTKRETTPRSLTYAKDVAPVVFAHCASCHHAGGSAPFSVLEYDAVRSHARQIVAATQSRRMPPWLPEPGFGEFAGDRRLTAEQIDIIRRWVDQGMVEGDRNELPAMPQFSGGWQLGEPDLIVKLPRPYTLQAGDEDVFRNFVIPIPVAQTQYVKTVEIRPGSATFVHHGLMAIDETRASRHRDEQDPELGFAGMDMGEAHMPDGSLLGWSPGMLPFPGIDGSAWRLQPHTDLVLQLHMMPSRRTQVVDPVVGFHFARTPGLGAPTYLLMLNADWALDIPPGDSNFVVSDAMELPVDVDVLVVYPHAHYLGRSLEAWATLPDGTRQSLIRIARWDFKWQDVYRFARPVPLPRGTTLTMQWVFDNSADHPHHLDRPPVRVRAGNRTTDEMAHLQMQVRVRRPEDRLALEEVYFRHLLAREPGNARFLYGLATALKDQGRWADAAAGYRLALESAPGYVLAHNNLGAVLMEQRLTDEALKHFQAAVALEPDFAGAHYNLAFGLASQGRLAEAVRHYRDAVRYDPDFAEAHANLGQVLVSQGKLEEAIPHLREAVRLMPDSAETHDNLGTALWQQGKLEEAVGHFRRALEIDPNHAEARHNLDAALGKIGPGGR